MKAVGIAASPSTASRSRVVVMRALERLRANAVHTHLIDLALLSADGLLGRRQTADVSAALQAVADARILAVGTPVYRATYSGLLKVFFDQLPQGGLAGKVAIPIMVGHGPAHSLAVDHGLGPLLASVGATVVPSGVYGTSEQLVDAGVAVELASAVDRAVREALALAAAVAD